MTYELAKKLKDAGYPQKFKCGSWYYSHDGEMMGYITRVLGKMDDVHEDDGDIVKPTLSELIEACDADLSHIKRYPIEEEVYWWAVSHSAEYPKGHALYGNNIEEQGKTPEEAVAKLWLALNQK